MFNRDEFELRMLNLIVDKHQRHNIVKQNDTHTPTIFHGFCDSYYRCSSDDWQSVFHDFKYNPFLANLSADWSNQNLSKLSSYHAKFDRFTILNSNSLLRTPLTLLSKLIIFNVDVFNIKEQIFSFRELGVSKCPHTGELIEAKITKLMRVGTLFYDKTYEGLWIKQIG